MSDSLGVVLRADNASFVAAMQQAGTVTEQQARRMQKDLAFLTKVASDFKATQQAANDSVAGIKNSAGMIEKLGFNTTVARRELIVLGHELSQGNYTKFAGSIGVLAEHSNLLAVAFSASGIAAIGATAGVAAFVVAAIAGSKETENLRKSLILTGNMAGQTGSSFDALAASAAAATVSTIGHSKDAVQALIGTGRISQQAMADATTATLLMEKLTGQSAEEIAGDFAKMGDGVAKWAQKHNEQYHYLTVAQFTYIKQLEDQGKKEQAEIANLQALNTHFAAVNTNLGYLERSWKAVKDMASSAWDAMKGLGKADTTAEQIAKLEADVANYTRGADPKSGNTTSMRNLYAEQAEQAKQKLALLKQAAAYEQVSASLQSRSAVANEAAIDKIMSPPKSAIDPQAWARFLSDIQKYNEESSIMAATSKAVADYDKWAADAKAKLRGETEKLTGAQQAAAPGVIEASRIWRQQAEQIKKATDAEAEMQKLLSDRHLVGPQKDPRTEQQTAINKYLNGLPDETKKAEALVNGSFQRMEDSIVNFAKTGKLSFSDLFSFMAEEYIRNMIRMAEQKLLTDSAGNFIGIGGIVSGIGSWFSSIAGSHATGLARVPYNGYPAILHEGERVQTAVQARAANDGNGGSVDASINGLSVGAGVSMAQVHSVVNQALAIQREQIFRTLRQQQVAA